jgi:uncharacterized protein
MDIDEFEWDPVKSAQNLDKHGIGFEQAALLWDDEDLFLLRSDQGDEERWLAVGMIGLSYWTAIFTTRGSKIRLISVRRARLLEIQCYE